MRFFGGGAKSKQPTNSPDTYAAQDTIEAVLAVARGPVRGLSKGLKGVYLNNTALQNSDGSSNFGSVEIDVLSGATPSEKFSLALGGAASSTSVNVTLASGIAVTRTLTQSNIDYIDFRFAIQQLMTQSSKGSNAAELKLKVEYKATTSITWLPAPFGGLVVPPPSTTNPTGNFRLEEGYDVESPTRLTSVSTTQPTVASTGDRWVSPTNSFLREYNGTAWVPANATFSGNTWTTTTGERLIINSSTSAITNAKANDAVYTGTETLEYNGASWINNIINFNTLFPNVNTSGNNYGAAGILVVNEKISSTSAKEIRVPVPKITGTYDVRVTKLSGDTVNDQLYSVVAWESCQQVVSGPLKMWGVAGYRIKARASDQFSSVPQFTADWDLMITKVPTNYDPTTRVYAGVWDGTWKSAFNNNPMWCACDMIIDEIDGMSALYPQTYDKWDAYDIARWCDESVNDGLGGTRPRHTYNKIDTDGIDAAQRVTDILGSCNTRYIDDGAGNISFICDKDSNPVALFTLENCGVDGEFVYSYTDPITRATEVTVTFQNKDLDYEEDRRIVRQTGTSRIPDAFFAVGKTNASEATAAAIYRLVTGLTETCSVTFTTDRRAKYLGLWETILIADERQAWGLTHRIKSFSGSSLQLFEPVSLEVGVTYQIVFEYVNTTTGVREPLVRTVTTPSGIVTNIIVNAALPSDLPPNATFTLSSASTSGTPRKFRVTSVNPSDEDVYVVTAIQVNPLKHYTIENWTGTAYNDVSQLTNSRTAGRVQNVKTEYIFADNVVVFSWDAPLQGITQSYILEVSDVRAGPFSIVSEGRSRSASFPVVSSFQQLFYKITAVPLIGLASLPVEGIFNLNEIATRGSPRILGPLPDPSVAILGMIYVDPTQPNKLFQRDLAGNNWVVISTIGAEMGGDITLPGGVTIAPITRIDNATITIDAAGRLTNTGTGNTIVDNSRISLTSGPLQPLNDEIISARRGLSTLLASVSAAALTGSWASIAGRPLSLADLDNIAQTDITNTKNELVVARNGQTTLAARLTQTDTLIVTNNNAAVTRLLALESATFDGTAGLAPTRARLLVEEQTRANADSALAGRATTLETAVNNPTTGLTSRALQTSLNTVESNLTGSIALARTDLRAEFQAADGTLNNAINLRVTTATFNSTVVALSDATSALSGQVNNLTVRSQTGSLTQPSDFRHASVSLTVTNPAFGWTSGTENCLQPTALRGGLLLQPDGNGNGGNRYFNSTEKGVILRVAPVPNQIFLSITSHGTEKLIAQQKYRVSVELAYVNWATPITKDVRLLMYMRCYNAANVFVGDYAIYNSILPRTVAWSDFNSVWVTTEQIKSVLPSAVQFAPMVIPNYPEPYANDTYGAVIDVNKIVTTNGTAQLALEASIQAVNLVSIDAQNRAYAISGTELTVNARKGGFVIDNNGQVVRFQITADDFRIFSQVGGNYISPFRVVNGKTEIDDALIRSLRVVPVGGGRGHRVLLAPETETGADGAVMSWSPPYGGIPLIRAVQPPQTPLSSAELSAGVTYEIKAVNASPSGFTVSAKKFSSGSPSAQNSGAGSNVGGTPVWQVSKPTATDADGGRYTYNMTVTLIRLNQYFEPGIGWEAYYEATVDLYYNAGAGWVLAFQEIIGDYYNGSAAPPATMVKNNYSVTAENLPAIGQGGNRFGLHAAAGSVTAFAGVTYTTTSQSGVSSLIGNFTFEVTPPS